MKLVKSYMIPKIDEFAERELGIPTRTLMKRAGEACADAVRDLISCGNVTVLAGSGNNGGDGYAAACALEGDFSLTVYDVFSKGQRSEAGNYFLNRAKALGIKILPLPEDITHIFDDADCIVDAVFGTGFSGEYPDCIKRLSSLANSASAARVAVDIPMGVDADTGEAKEFALCADVTVALSYAKVGLVSYPAKEYVGRVIHAPLGLDTKAVEKHFVFSSFLVDCELARTLLPPREQNSSKGSFGKALLIVGSNKFPGAAHLALEATLRSGIGYATLVGSSKLCAELRMKLPEAIYKERSLSEVDEISELSARCDVTLVGSGSDCTEELAHLVTELIKSDGKTLVLDADALNAISKYCGADVLKDHRRPIVITPHPLEMSRLSSESVEYINSHRIRCAEDFSKKYGCITLLKGAASIITDGSTTYVNSSGSSALAKAGSGDVLSGIIAALIAQGKDPLAMTALAAYIHGKAGDELSHLLSDYGVIPSDLPRKAAEIISKIKRGCRI